jgi:hypothetical protein
VKIISKRLVFCNSAFFYFDTLFFFIVGFLLSLTLTRTFSSYPYSVILAVLISAFFSVFIFAFLKRKRVKKYGLKIDQKTLQNTLLTMYQPN